MSGPKLSAVELEAIRRRQIAEQRRRNESILRRALGEIGRAVARARDKSAALGRYQAEAVAKLDAIERRYSAAAVRIVGDGYPDDPILASSFNDDVSGLLLANASDLREALSAEVESWSRDIRGAEETKALDAFSKALSSVTQTAQCIEFGSEMIARMLEGQAMTNELLVELEAESKVRLLERAGSQLAEMQSLLMCEAIPAARKNILLSVAETLSSALRSLETTAHAEVELSNVLRASEPELVGLRKLSREMQEVYALCECEAERISSCLGKVETIPRLSHFSGIAELRAFYEELHEEAQSLAEEAYIAHAMDEVMRRHGYTVKRSVHLFSADERPHSVYLDGLSDVGIHSYIAANGTIMMETGSFDESIRTCEEEQEVRRFQPSTQHERARLVKQQESFCELFPELVSDLAELGVIVRKKNDMAPSEATSVTFSAVSRDAAAPSRDEERARRDRQSHSSGTEREMR